MAEEKNIPGVATEKESDEVLEEIRTQTKEVLKELLAVAKMKPGQILVVGCSSSEIGSYKIGSHSSEEEAAEKYGYEPVNVVPQLKAGGSFSTAAYHTLEHPVAVEHIKAHAGIDIGDTLIGMHMRDVAVPVRIQTKAIGGAHVVCARTRLKFVGGIRARYDEEQM